MKSLRVWLLLCIPCSGLAAQGQRSVLVRTDRALADSSWSAGFRATLAASALPDAVLLWPGAPVVQGLPAIDRLLESDNLKATWQPMTGHLCQTIPPWG